MKKRPFLARLAAAGRAAVAAMRDQRPAGRRNFAGANVNRLTGDWLATLRGADEEIRKDVRMLRARSRDLARNNSYFKEYLRLLVTNVLGDEGIKLIARNSFGSGRPRSNQNKKIEAAWDAWKKGRVTVDGRLTYHQASCLALRTLAQDGEVIVRLWRGFPRNPHGFAIQFLDADTLDDTYIIGPGPGHNEVRLGVEIDLVGAPVAYWFRDRIGMNGAFGPRYRVPADEILHIYDHDRVNQTRGIPWCHSIMLPVGMLEGYEEAELVAARMGASKMGFITNAAPEGEGNIDPETGEVLPPTPISMEFNPGSIEMLSAGQQYVENDPTHPTTAFPTFVKQILRKIATGLGVFYNMLANDAEGVSYSTARTFRLIEIDKWRSIQKFWIEQFEAPLYAEWLGMAMLAGTVQVGTYDKTKYLDVMWQARGFDWVDPEVEAKAVKLELDNRLTSRTRVLAERGLDFETILMECSEEKKLADAYGVSLEVVPIAPPAQTPPTDSSTSDSSAAQPADTGAPAGDPSADDPNNLG